MTSIAAHVSAEPRPGLSATAYAPSFAAQLESRINAASHNYWSDLFTGAGKPREADRKGALASAGDLICTTIAKTRDAEWSHVITGAKLFEDQRGLYIGFSINPDELAKLTREERYSLIGQVITSLPASQQILSRHFAFDLDGSRRARALKTPNDVLAVARAGAGFLLGGAVGVGLGWALGHFAGDLTLAAGAGVKALGLVSGSAITSSIADALRAIVPVAGGVVGAVVTSLGSLRKSVDDRWTYLDRCLEILRPHIQAGRAQLPESFASRIIGLTRGTIANGYPCIVVHASQPIAETELPALRTAFANTLSTDNARIFANVPVTIKIDA